MYFKDIQQVIEDGDWECSFSLKGFIGQIEEFIAESNLILEPDFQRGHVWTEEQQVAYIESLLQGGAKHARVIYLNDPDWRVCNKTNEYKEFVCVDGLQRYTAVKRFVNNKIKAFGCYASEFEDSRIMLQHPGMLRINVNALKSKKEVLTWYLQMNAGGTPHSKKEIERVREMLHQL